MPVPVVTAWMGDSVDATVQVIQINSVFHASGVVKLSTGCD